ncbi:amino acid permease [Macrococcus hajekii]|uniref:Amino acid permease n=1 Tax=Macrococcus hajekii TaxID=198482 RepID=A0A4R6BJF6_9STAP|nr:amino acid permease [Macrococcus hajekii]TDM01716.1 amino acid permease [Macrococcus hajekii]GGB06806.1 amino acid permease [Macrococcus hajekii]
MAGNTELKKDIGLFPALALVMGTVIGSGVFFKVATITDSTQSVGLTLLVWILGGIMTICAGLTAAELAAAIPETGGMTKYLEYTYGDFWGFLSGWALAFIYFPANVAAQAIVFGTQLVNLFHLDQNLVVPISIIAALSILLINLIGSKAGGMLQSITLVVKLIPLVLIIVFGLFQHGNVDFSLFPPIEGDNGLMSIIGAGLLATMFAYDGWMHVGNIAGEMKNPKKDLPLAITVGIGLVMAIYLLINAAFLLTLPISALAGNENAAADTAMALFGDQGGKLITMGILISVYGALNGYTMTGMRVPYAMAENGMLPFNKWFLKLTNSGAPWFSGLILYIIAMVMVTLGAFDSITNMLIFVIWLFYCMTFVAVMILRKREPNMERPYKVPLYPIIPLIALVSGLFVLGNTLMTQTTLALIGIGITLLGVPIYYYKKNQNKKHA